jgi:hypothetical protein
MKKKIKDFFFFFIKEELQSNIFKAIIGYININRIKNFIF